jgi:hypothetical protein
MTRAGIDSCVGRRSADEDKEFPVAAWDHFNGQPIVKMIKTKDWAALSGHIAKQGGRAQQEAFVLNWRGLHSGASLLHLTILYGVFEEVGKPLVHEFGHALVGMCYKQPLQAPPDAPAGWETWYRPKFEGENALHLVIAKCAGNEDAAIAQLKFLLDNGPPTLVNARAEGTFFSMRLSAYSCLARARPVPLGKACMGETPLNFAVCLNLPRVVRFLVEYGGADLTEGDGQNKWTPCHMAVYAERTAMLNFLEKLWTSVRARCKGREGQPVMLIPGARTGYVLPEKHRHTTFLYMLLDGQRRSPLTLAASEGRLEMFENLWKSQSQLEWGFAEHTCKFYPLDDIETWPYDEDGGDAIDVAARASHAKMTAFELLTHDDDEAGKIMRSGPFEELLKQKWLRYAREMFRKRLYGWLVMLALITLLLLQKPDDEPALLWGVILIGAAVKLHMTLRDAWVSGGAHRFFCARGSTFIERYFSIMFLLCLAYWGAFKVCGTRGGMPPTAPLDTVAFNLWRDSAMWARALLPFFGYLYLIWFLLGYETTAPLTVMLWRILVGDIPAFALVLSVVLLAYVSHFFVDRGSEGGWLKYIGLFGSSMGEVLSTEAHKEEDASFFSLLNFSFHVMGLLLTNLLVAMMNNTYSKTLDDSLNQSCLERARIIAQIDRSLTVEQKKEKTRVDPYFVVKKVAGIPMRRWLRVEEVRWKGKPRAAREHYFIRHLPPPPPPSPPLPAPTLQMDKIQKDKAEAREAAVENEAAAVSQIQAPAAPALVNTVVSIAPAAAAPLQAGPQQRRPNRRGSTVK